MWQLMVASPFVKNTTPFFFTKLTLNICKTNKKILPTSYLLAHFWTLDSVPLNYMFIFPLPISHCLTVALFFSLSFQNCSLCCGTFVFHVKFSIKMEYTFPDYSSISKENGCILIEKSVKFQKGQANFQLPLNVVIQRPGTNKDPG